MHALGKHIAFLKISFFETLKHHGKLYGRLFLYMLIILIISQLWQAISLERNIENLPFTFAQIVWYVAITEWIVMSSYRSYIIFDDDIRTGNIVCFFTRPLSYFMMRHMQTIGSTLTNAVIFIWFGIAVSYLITDHTPDALYIVPFIIVLGLLAMLLDQIFQAIIGLCALWLQESQSFFLIYQKMLFIMGGLLFPLDIYPDWAKEIALNSPFAAMLYKPAKLIYDPSLSDALNILIELIIWCGIGYTVAFAVFAICQRKLEINGG